MHQDDSRYPNPDKFDPDRFLNHTSSAAASANYSNPAERDHFSYGSGKRICPGIHLAERSLFTVTSRVLHAFTMSQPLSCDSASLTTLTVDDVGTKTGLIMSPGRNFYVEFKPRSEQMKELIEREWRGKVAGVGESWME